MAQQASWISLDDLLHTDYAMLALTSTVFIARIVVQVWRRKNMEWQDGWLYVAFAAYATMCILYTHITPTFFKLEKINQGEVVPWDGMQKDIKLTTEVIFTSGVMFWTCLWSVKFSLLALYKKLLLGLEVVWVYTYWGIVVFCVLTYISCFITGPAIACNHPWKLFNEGVMCFSSKEVRHQTVSMYYAFAVDVLTNLMVMFLPLRLIMPLHIPRGQKLGVGTLFASGFLCIIFSTIRIVQITSRDGKPHSPDPKWLTMWTIIECSTAIIIGCCPMLAALIPKPNASRRLSLDVQGYVRQSPSRTNGTTLDGIKLRSINSLTNSRKKSSSETYWSGTHVSQEELPPSPAPVKTMSLVRPDEEMIGLEDERRADPRDVRQLRRTQ